MSNAKGKTFFAKVAKGYIPKTMFDSLATSMGRITLWLTKEGIFLRDSDTDDIRYSHMLWDITWPRKRFALYRCVKEYIITLNSKHLQRMLRNVKKKDSLCFFIKKDDESQIGITIQPAGSQPDGPAARSETVYLSIKKNDEMLMAELPEFYLDADGEKKEAYGFPMVIGATDFQKIKKMASTTRTLNVKIQGSNYISFYAGDKTVMSSDLAFGELIDNYSEENDAPSEDEEDTSSIRETTAQLHVNSKSEVPPIYDQSFNMSLFLPLVKLPGLTPQMEFYAPKVDGFPLKVSMHTSSGLGDVTVFVKDQKQIALEEQKKSQETVPALTLNKTNRRVKK